MIRRPLIRIDDPDDPAIAEFCSIREKDLTGRKGQFIAEGSVVLRLLASAHRAKSRFRAEKILLLESKVSGLSELLEEFPDDVPVYIADTHVLDSIAGFHLHRGILALGSAQSLTNPAQTMSELPEKALVVVGIGMSNHDNIGSMFRNSAAFAVDHFFLDNSSCDPLYRKAIRVSVGSVLTVSWTRHGNGEELLQLLADNQFQILGLSPRGETDLRDFKPSNRVALVMGTEGEGLPVSILSKIGTIRIAQAPGIDSLNLGTATGIALFHAASAMGKI